jgi:serine phosphatase RsbU (regulator of sigma subunit)
VDEDQTKIVTLAHSPDERLDERVHCLEFADGDGGVRRHVIGPAGATIGRSAPSEIVLIDSEASRTHCRLVLVGEELIVEDLNSTNGTFVDGSRLRDPTPLPVGAILRVGRSLLKHEWRTCLEVLQSEQLDRELALASAYVEALLPPPIAAGPIRADWLYEPSAKLGGDCFGYGALSAHKFVAYLIDVSGHGAGAAMHSVSLMNMLREHAVPGADLGAPSQVLAVLNDMFQMDRHADMYFTMWYGVFDDASRRLEFASAGHHPAFMTQPGGGEAVPLRTKNGLIGAAPGKTFASDATFVPPGASVFLFSDGVFEIVTTDGVEWSLQDFLPLILRPPVNGLTTCQRIFRDVTNVARPGGFDDDFSLVQLTFD